MLYHLSDVRHTTIDNLISRYGVSRSTVIRDVDELSLEAPIYKVQGNGGGIYVENDWYASRRYLSKEQTELLKKVLSGLQPEDKKVMQEILDSFGNKLSA
jgi:predicted DNA-binding transcriptional regulator YafY